MLREKFTENLNYSQFFSFEVLDYFYSICTDENYKWIGKYFDVLMKEENKSAKKFNKHHIRPCFSFKDKEHKNRKETQKLADKFNDNLIKLSIYNHTIAHYCLWKIFNNWDSKTPFQRMCNKKDLINNLTENELKEIAKLQEDCAKTNKTEEEIKERKRNYGIKYREENKDDLKQSKHNYYINNMEHEKNRAKEDRLKLIDEVREYDRERYYKNKEQKLEYAKTRYQEKHDEILEKQKALSNQKCYDPKENDFCSLQALQKRKRKDKEKYKDVKPIECLVKTKDQQ